MKNVERSAQMRATEISEDKARAGAARMLRDIFPDWGSNSMDAKLEEELAQGIRAYHNEKAAAERVNTVWQKEYSVIDFDNLGEWKTASYSIYRDNLTGKYEGIDCWGDKIPGSQSASLETCQEAVNRQILTHLKNGMIEPIPTKEMSNQDIDISDNM